MGDRRRPIYSWTKGVIRRSFGSGLLAASLTGEEGGGPASHGQNQAGAEENHLYSKTGVECSIVGRPFVQLRSEIHDKTNQTSPLLDRQFVCQKLGPVDGSLLQTLRKSSSRRDSNLN